MLPGRTVLKGEVRARAPADRVAVDKFMRQIVAGVAATHGVEATMSFNTEFVEAFNARCRAMLSCALAAQTVLTSSPTIRR